MKKKMIRCAPRVFGVLILSLGLALLLVAFLAWPSNRVVAQWHQPDGIDYQSYDPYTLSVIEGSRQLLTTGWPRRHCIFIGQDYKVSSYGRRNDYSFHGGLDELDTYIESSTVEWTPEGVTFVEANGKTLFVPKKLFIGGR